MSDSRQGCRQPMGYMIATHGVISGQCTNVIDAQRAAEQKSLTMADKTQKVYLLAIVDVLEPTTAHVWASEKLK